MSRRFFVEAPIADQGVARLTGQEAQHLGRVLRAKPGDEVVLFDGQGAEYAAQVEAVSRSEVELRVLDRYDVDRETARAVTLAVAMPKGDRQRWLVEKAVELGVRRLIPLNTRRGVAQPTSSALKRLHRAVVEASKQCGRNRLMEISEPASLPELSPMLSAASERFIAHPNGELLPSNASGDVTECCAAIGPEGGFTDEEVAHAVDAGWRRIALGPRILRVETAALWLAARLCQ